MSNDHVWPCISIRFSTWYFFLHVLGQVIKLHSDLEEQIHANTQLLAENSQKQVELKIKDDEIQSVKAEVVRINKVTVYCRSLNEKHLRLMFLQSHGCF